MIAVWLVLLAGSAWFSLHQTDHLSGGGWEVPGSASIRVSKLIDTFPGVTPPTFTFFVTGSSATAVQTRLATIEPALRGTPRLRPGAPVLLAGGRAALLPVDFVGATSNAIDEATKLRHAFVQTSSGGADARARRAGDLVELPAGVEAAARPRRGDRLSR